MAKENELNQPQEPTTPPAATSEMPNRDKWLANMRAKYGDELSEDDLYAKSTEGYDAEHEYAKKNREQTKNLNDIMNEYPEVADMYINLAEGKVGAAILNIGDLVDAYRKGEIDDEGYKAEVAKRKKDKEDTDAAMAAQDEVLIQWCEKKGYNPKKWIARLSEQLLTPMKLYKMAEAQFEALDKMLNYDTAVQAAEIKGRNQKIIEEKRNHPSGIETLPRNGGAAAPSASKKQMDVFDLANAAQ